MMAHLQRLVRVAMVIVGSVALAAQSTPAADAFQPVKPGDLGEHLPATPLVFYAYAFVWLALITYIFLLWRRVGRVEQELAIISERFQAKRR